jgi:hypothetical protein
VTFLKFFTPFVRGQRQADAVSFDISQAFDLVPHNMLLRILSSFGFSDDYVSWFRSYLSISGWHFWHSLPAFSSNVQFTARLCSEASSFQHIHK